MKIVERAKMNCRLMTRVAPDVFNMDFYHDLIYFIRTSKKLEFNSEIKLVFVN